MLNIPGSHTGKALNQIWLKLLPVTLLVLISICSSCGNSGKDQSTAQDLKTRGEELFLKYACTTCHSRDGSEMYGPPLNGIYRTQEMVNRSGKTITVTIDRKYIKRSIVDPDFEKVLKYQNSTMPVPVISPKDVDVLVDYIISL